MSLDARWKEYRLKFEMEYSDSEIVELHRAFYAGAQAAITESHDYGPGAEYPLQQEIDHVQGWTGKP